MKKIISLIIVLLFITVNLVSCFQKDPDVLIVGISPGQPPWSFYDDENNMVGFDIDISEEIAKRLKKGCSFQKMPFSQLIPKLSRGHIDFVATGMYVTEERKKVLSYCKPYGIGCSQLVVKKDSNITSLEDIKGTDLKIGVRNGTVHARFLADNGYADNMIVFPTQNDIILGFITGKMDAILTDRYIIKHMIKTEKFDMKLVGNCVSILYASIGVNKDNTELLNAINETLEEMFKDGTYDKIANKWFEELPLEKFSEDLKSLDK